MLRANGLLILGASLIFSMRAVGETPGVTDNDIKVGATQPLTGPIAFYSEMTKGSRALFQDINERGGIHGRKITYLIEDDSYSTPKTIAATRKLVEKEHVFAMFQALGMPHTAVADYLKQKGVPDLFLSDGSKLWDLHRTAFMGMVPWLEDGRYVGKYLADKYPGKTVGFLFENSNQGKEGVQGAKEEMKGKLTFGPEYGYDPGASNVDSQMAELLKAHVDVIASMTATNITASAAKYASQQGSKLPFVVSYINGSPEFIGLGGGAVEGAVSATFLSLPGSNDPGVENHQKLLEKYFPGSKASAITIYGQAQAELLVETLKRAGRNLTRDGAVKAAESIKNFRCSLCLMPGTITEKDHHYFKNAVYMQVRQGKWVKL